MLFLYDVKVEKKHRHCQNYLIRLQYAHVDKEGIQSIYYTNQSAANVSVVGVRELYQKGIASHVSHHLHVAIPINSLL